MRLNIAGVVGVGKSSLSEYLQDEGYTVFKEQTCAFNTKKVEKVLEPGKHIELANIQSRIINFNSINYKQF